MSGVGLEHYLLFSAFLFSVGLYGALTRRNAVAILMSVEVMFNAVNVAFIAANRFVAPAGSYAGQVFTMFVITVAAGEAAVGLALMINIYRSRDTVDVDEITLMKW
ncbi:MAG: NADH-quinone oxidoreductase subunit NuoK [Chloroflexi bacterium]|nr:NADH-quinone oxidoreductase subunit NuoK [Chloroflexota bacterium]